MNLQRARLAIVAGSTLALVLAGAGIVSAQSASPAPDTTKGTAPRAVPFHRGPGGMHGRDDLRGRGGRSGDRGGWGRGGAGRGPLGDPRGGWGGRGVLPGIARSLQGLVSQEVVRLDADGNVLTSRLQHGTVTANADGSLTIGLATGESATLTTAAATQAFDWSTATRPMRAEVAVADIAAGADVLVWSQRQDDGSFLAQRIVVLPAPAADTTPAASPSPAAVG